MPQNTATRRDRFHTFVAVMVAVTALVTALVAWRAAVAGDRAGDANGTGLAASLNSSEAHTLNLMRAFEHYRGYEIYTREKLLANLLDADGLRAFDEAEATSGEAVEAHTRVEALVQRRDDAHTASAVSQYFFVPEYLNPDATYNFAHEFGATEADAARRRDLNAEAHFAVADQWQTKSLLLIGVAIVLAVALWFLAAAQGMRHRLRYGLASAGALCLAAGAVTFLIVEFLVRP